MEVIISIGEDDTVQFSDSDGNALSPEIKKITKQQNGSSIREWTQEQADEINTAIDQIGNIHLLTPKPDIPLNLDPRPFDRPKPQKPELEVMSLIRWLFSPKEKQRAKEHNEKRLAAYRKAVRLRETLKEQHAREELRRKKDLAKDIRSNVAVMEEFLADRLSEIAWPRETLVSLGIGAGGKKSCWT